MEQKDLKILNDTINKMETQIDALKYYFYNIKSKENTVKLAKMVLADMDNIFSSKVKDFQKKMLNHIAEQTKNENFSAKSKINSPDANALKRMGKLLKIESSIVTRIIKSNSEKGLTKQGKINEI